MNFTKCFIFKILVFCICFNSIGFEDKFLDLRSFFEKNISRDELLEELQLFHNVYKKRLIKTNDGGLRSVSMFWVWYIVKKINPDLIVESGVWKGQSTWLLEQAAPNAKIVSIDPDLSRRVYVSPKAFYYTKDFDKIDFGDISNLVTLCFFDDHQNALQRVMQANSKGFNHLIFDDNYPVGEGGHLTLAHCLSNGEFQKIESIVSFYKVFPQIFGTTVLVGKKSIPIDSFNLQNKDSWLSTYKEDAPHYRWVTYLLIGGAK